MSESLFADGVSSFGKAVAAHSSVCSFSAESSTDDTATETTIKLITQSYHFP